MNWEAYDKIHEHLNHALLELSKCMTDPRPARLLNVARQLTEIQQTLNELRPPLRDPVDEYSSASRNYSGSRLNRPETEF